MIKILIVEDQAMLRDSLEQVIGGQPDMKVAGTAVNASKSPELCRELKPDLVLMDVITENDANGITWAARIRQELPDIKIVIMTALPEITFIDEARRAGVHSYVYKNAGNDHLFYVIRSTMKGVGVYPGPESRPPFSEQFTEKEIAVIRLVCQGKTRGEMMKELDISESTLKPIVTSILDKTGFDSIMKFAVYAVGRGLIVPDR
ncbi:MAG: response regulator transcription factor [Spirochaetaceae bacterium]|nr:response regulator transcription factor [Spirochaetaceae bacterium]